MPLDPHEEQRLRVLEDSHVQQTALYQQMTGTLNQIHTDLRAAITLQGLVNDHDKQIKKLWNKIDECEDMAGRFDLLMAEHTQCKPKVDQMAGCAPLLEHRIKSIEDWKANVGSFAQGRVASLTDKALWALIGLIVTLSVMFGAKGYFK